VHVCESALETPSRISGYMGDPEETARALKGELVLTGDFGYLRGQELFWVGRVRERINVFGKKYDPSDFEAALAEIAGLRPGCFAASGVDDERRGTERLVLVAEFRDLDGHSRDETVEATKERVSTEMGVSVDEVILLPKGTMSKTSSGKRRHRFYKALYESGELEALERQLEPARE